MLRRVGQETEIQGVPVTMENAAFPVPFRSGLEYAAPARGTWNIVHTGMLIPQAHEIFVCAQGCLRGVVLTAAEMSAQTRFSTVAIREQNVLDGDMENLLVEGVTDILRKLPALPPAVLVYTSCIHHFIGCDLALAYDRLRQRFPGVDFTDCYMNPIMRKSGITPDALMRRQLYSLLRPQEKREKTVLLAGNDLPMLPSCDLARLLKAGGWELREITGCKTYAEYLALAECTLCITVYPAAGAAGEELHRRLDMPHSYLSASFSMEELEETERRFCEEYALPLPDFASERSACEAALTELHERIGETPIAIDYTAVSRPLSLARLLWEHGLRVTRLYADGFTGEEAGDFQWLREHAPEIALYPTVHPAMRVLERTPEERFFAVGQKAAYFTGTDRFVNMVEGGGLWGYDGIRTLCRYMIEAYDTPKEARNCIQAKGLGCACCL